MSGAALSFFCGERDRAGERPLGEAAIEELAGAGLPAAALLRGAEGFGGGLRLGTDRLLSLSEDLPLLATAIGSGEHVEAAARRLAALAPDALVAVEQVWAAGPDLAGAADPDEEVRLTVFTGHRERRRGKPAHVAVVAALHRHGVAGATTLLGVDGAASGQRLRAGMLGANSWVPAVTRAVGRRGRIGAALADLGEPEEPPPAVVRPVVICRRDGAALARPSAVEARSALSRLSVYCSTASRLDGRPIASELISRLREERADGATALRGIWGYHGDHEPHGDRALGLRRRVPVLVEVLDAPERCLRWLDLAAELTAETGLVTLEHGIDAPR